MKSEGDQLFFLKLQTAAECDGFSTTNGVVRSQIINHGRQLCLLKSGRQLGLLKSERGIVVFEVSRRSIVLHKSANGGECDFFLKIS